MDIFLAFKNIQANAKFSALYKTEHSYVTQGKNQQKKGTSHLSQGVPPVASYKWGGNNP